MHGIDMTDDSELISRVRDYIQKQGRYVTFDELSNAFNMSKIQFTYRGVNLTSLNSSLGFRRRPPKIWAVPTRVTREEVIEAIRSRIRSEGRYLSISTLTRKLYVFHEDILRGFNIDVHALNAEEGFVRKSPYERVNKAQLAEKFRDYIFNSDHYVTQYELCKVFDVKPSLLTKSGIDTVQLNSTNGKSPSYSWFEDTLHEVLLELGFTTIIRQKMFEDCRSKKGRMLRFDFYIENLSLLIEADGSQHWDETHFFHTQTQVDNDLLKQDYCSTKGLLLLRVTYPSTKLTNGSLKSILLESLSKVFTKAELEKAGVKVDNEHFEIISSQDSKET